MSNNVKVVEIQTRFDKAIQDMAKWRTEIDELTDSEKALKKNMDDWTDAEKKQNMEIIAAMRERSKVLKENISTTSKAIQQEISEITTLKGSTADLTNQYKMLDNQMGKIQRDMQTLQNQGRENSAEYQELSRQNDALNKRKEAIQAIIQATQEAKSTPLILGEGMDKTFEDLVKAKQKIEGFKVAQKDLDEQYKQGKITLQEYTEATTKNKIQQKQAEDAVRAMEKTLRNEVTAEKAGVDSLKGMRAELSNLTAQFDSMSAAKRKSLAGAELQAKINLTTNKIKEAETATQRFYRNVGNYQSAVAGIQKIGGAFKGLLNTISLWGGQLTFGMFTKNMVQVASEFENSMARVRAVTNASTKDMEALTAAARKMGETTRYTAKEAADALEVLARAGLNAKDSISALAPTMHLAQANSIALADAARISLNTMRAFGMQVNELDRVNDVLSSTASHSATNIIELGEAMKNAAPIAKTAKVSIEETSAALGTLANVGIKGSEAGTGVKQMLMGLAKADVYKKSQAVLKKYGVDITEATLKTEGLIVLMKRLKEAGVGNDLGGLGKIFGQYGSPRAAALIQNVDQFQQLYETLQDSEGETARMFEQSMGKTSYALAMLKSTWESFMLTIYDSTESIFVKPVEWITKLIQLVRDNMDTLTTHIFAVFAGFKALPMLQSALTALQGFSNKAIAIANQSAVAFQTSVAKELQAKERVEMLKTQATSAQGAKRIAIERQLAQAEIELTTATENKKSAYKKMMRAKERVDQVKALAEQKALLSSLPLTVSNVGKRMVLSWKTTWLSMKTATITAVESMKAVMSSFLPMLALTALIEGIAYVYRLVTAVDELKKSWEDVNQEVARTVGENMRIQKAEELLKKYQAVKKNTQEEGELISEINKLLGTTFTKETDIEHSLARQIAQMKALIALETYKARLVKIGGDMSEIKSKYGIDLGVSDIDATDALTKKWEDSPWYEQYLGWGSDLKEDRHRWALLYREKLQLNQQVDTLIGEFGDLTKKTEATTEVTPEGESKYDSYKKKETEKKPKKPKNKKEKSEPVVDMEKVRKDNELKYLAMLEKAKIDILEDSNAKKALLLKEDLRKQQAELEEAMYIYKRAIEKRDSYKPKTKEYRYWEKQAVLTDKAVTYIQDTIKLKQEKFSIEMQRLSRAQSIQFIKDDVEIIKQQIELAGKDFRKVLSKQLDEINQEYTVKLQEIEEQYMVKIQSMSGRTDEYTNILVQYDKNAKQIYQYFDKMEKLIAKIRQAKADGQNFWADENGELYSERGTEVLVDTALYDAEGALKEYKEKALKILGSINVKDILDEINKSINEARTTLADQSITEDARKTAQEQMEKGYRDAFALENNQEFFNEYLHWWEMYYKTIELADEKHNKDVAHNAIETQEGINNETQMQMENAIKALELYKQAELLIYNNYWAKLREGEKDYWDYAERYIGERDRKIYEERYKAAEENYNATVALNAQKVANGEMTDEEMQASNLEAQQNMLDVLQDTSDAVVQCKEAEYESLKAIIGSMGDLFNQLGEFSKEAAFLAQTITLAQVIFDQAKAISSVYEQEISTKGFVGLGTGAAIAGAVAAVFSQIVKTVKSAKFAEGAVGIYGAGSSKSDSIPAYISNGESVMNAKATKMFAPLLMAMNDIGNGVPLPHPRYNVAETNEDMERMRDMFINAVADIKPVVSVEEINRVSNNVKVIQSLDNI